MQEIFTKYAQNIEYIDQLYYFEQIESFLVEEVSIFEQTTGLKRTIDQISKYINNFCKEKVEFNYIKLVYKLA